MAHRREYLRLVTSDLPHGCGRDSGAATCPTGSDGYQRGTLYPCWALLDRRLPRGEEPLTSRRDTHDRALYGTGYWRLWGYTGLCLQLAYDLLYLRDGGYGLCIDPHPTAA